MKKKMTSLEIDGVQIDIEQGASGLFYGTSPEVCGLLVTGDTEEMVIAKVPGALIDLKAAQK